MTSDVNHYVNETVSRRYVPRGSGAVEACRYALDGANRDDLMAWCSWLRYDGELRVHVGHDGDDVEIVEPGQWVVRDLAGRLVVRAHADLQREWVLEEWAR